VCVCVASVLAGRPGRRLAGIKKIEERAETKREQVKGAKRAFYIVQILFSKNRKKTKSTKRTKIIN